MRAVLDEAAEMVMQNNLAALRQAGAMVVRHGLHPIFAVGAAARDLVAAAEEAGGETRWFATAADAADAVADELRDGDVLLVKGSRGVGLDYIVRQLLAGRGRV